MFFLIQIIKKCAYIALLSESWVWELWSYCFKHFKVQYSNLFKIIMLGDVFPVKGLHDESLGLNIINNLASAIFFYRVWTRARDVSLRDSQYRLWANSALSSKGHARRTRKRDSIARTVSAPGTWAIITSHALFVREEMFPLFGPFAIISLRVRAVPMFADESLSLLLAAHLPMGINVYVSTFSIVTR